MFFVYCIYNIKKNLIYIDQTSDLEKRIMRHNGLLPSKRKSFTSRNDGVWVLVYKENLETRRDAMRREKALKSFGGRKFLKEQIIKYKFSWYICQLADF